MQKKKDTLMKLLRENFGWIKDLAMVAGMIGVLYLNSNFVTNAKFESYTTLSNTKYELVQAAIISIDKQLILSGLNTKILNDLNTKVNQLAETQRLEDNKTHTEVLEVADRLKELDFRIRILENK